ncbi:MAG: GWxTD domain-containing protein [Lentimicrobium sp.]|jgi:GWxTD domain-containing protein|nr:GWxTD domain-containing protein [Lentimicrobium sp.]MDD2526788.1 GWxTD domain-containing protein [Lentimicrobiaceae bacterium]MDY0024754.1 GWxTD domain-containing protein [Lentimicrobium sp.]
MKKATITFLVFFSGFLTAIAGSQGPGAYFAHGVYNIPGQGPYLETYIEILGNTINYTATAPGNFQGKVQITLIIKQDSIIKDFRKYELKSPEITDTVKVALNFIDQQRFLMENGQYTIELSISDLNKPDNRASFVSYPVNINFPSEDISISSIQLVKEFTKTKEENPLSKSGFDILPYVDNFYGPTQNKLIYYAEIYNPGAVEYSSERYLISSYIESFESRQLLNNYVQIKRESASPVRVILNEFDVSDLPSGNYNLVISIRDKSNTIVAHQATFFQRFNERVKSVSAQLQEETADNTFATQINNIQELREYIRSLSPISTESEKLFMKTYIETADIKDLQQFFYNFWYHREPQQPEQAWVKYNTEVIKANNSYATQVRKGYETDMGRVYLQYGPPNSITDMPFESGGMLGEGSIPYQIWHYYELDNGRQRNKKFVFASSELRSKDYTLIHSDALGEIQNWGWQEQLKRQHAGKDTEDEMRRNKGRTGTFYNNPF